MWEPTVWKREVTFERELFSDVEKNEREFVRRRGFVLCDFHVKSKLQILNSPTLKKGEEGS